MNSVLVKLCTVKYILLKNQGWQWKRSLPLVWQARETTSLCYWYCIQRTDMCWKECSGGIHKVTWAQLGGWWKRLADIVGLDLGRARHNSKARAITNFSKPFFPSLYVLISTAALCICPGSIKYHATWIKVLSKSGECAAKKPHESIEGKILWIHISNLNKVTSRSGILDNNQ